MTKIDIISGFLGAGKTTFIRKLISEVYGDEKIVLIENEFGEINVDGEFLQDSKIEIKQMSSGCICCSLAGDFKTSLLEVIEKFSPDRILIEPSGVGKLSDVMAAVSQLNSKEAILDLCITVADAKKCKIYFKNFGEFFNNQIEFANVILLSRTKNMDVAKINEAVKIIRDLNKEAAIITTNWDELNRDDILDACKDRKDRLNILMKEAEHLHQEHEEEHNHDHEHHHDHDHDHEHHHDHDHDHEHHHDHDHEHHHDHDHDHDHDHEHHHDHHHEHDHHHHHHADEIFDSIGFEAPIRIDREKLLKFLKILSENKDLGNILRAKGIVEDEKGTWLHFDMVPDEYEIRQGRASYTGMLCIIGSDLNKDKINEFVKKELKLD